MAYLGTPYRITYAAKNFVSGLTTITAKVMRPDNAVVGSFTLTELPSAAFSGVYYADLITSVDDPEGEWIGLISSPSEGAKVPFRVSFSSNRLELLLENTNVIIAQEMRSNVTLEIYGGEEIDAQIFDDELIEAEFETDDDVDALVIEEGDIDTLVYTDQSITGDAL